MHRKSSGFLSEFASLWFRLIGIAIIALVFAEVLFLASGQAQGWTYYLTGSEVAFEVVVRLVAAALGGVALGSLISAIIGPFFWHFDTSRKRLAEAATEVAVLLALYLDSRLALKVLIKESNFLAGWPVTVLLTVHFLAFAAALCIPRGRKKLVSSFDDILGEKMTRRTAIVAGIASAGLAAAEWTMGEVAMPDVASARAPRPSGPNVLLVTFDAMSADDMNVYGYHLPTTPHINEFAGKSTVFDNFYSVSTFTTPGIATILTGVYPSEHRVYQLEGRLSGDYARSTLPHLMRAGGYATGASASNPFAYFLAEDMGYDVLPDPPYRTGGLDLWRATRIFHQRQPYGSRAAEFDDLEKMRDYRPAGLDRSSPRLFGRTESGFPPAASFAQARNVLDRLPDGFFMWVHIMAPHSPYLPDAPWQGRFLPRREMLSEMDQEFPGTWHHYEPGLQHLIDKARLRYDEFIGEADSAFGRFVSELEGVGRLKNTAVIVSADHGESFEGGTYRHSGPYQTRPKIHIPLIVRMPGQQQGNRLNLTADQTVLAPTILDIAGLPRPSRLRGGSLVPLLNSDNGGGGQGLAFTQYLETNSIFAPLRSGTVGVIDGQHQYVLDLATQKGILRPLNEAQMRDLDRSAENPVLAETLRATIYSRFPDLPRKTA